jgi:hypothetical protein
MSGGILMMLLGVWLVLQTTKGGLVARLGIS